MQPVQHFVSPVVKPGVLLDKFLFISGFLGKILFHFVQIVRPDQGQSAVQTAGAESGDDVLGCFVENTALCQRFFMSGNRVEIGPVQGSVQVENDQFDRVHVKPPVVWEKWFWKQYTAAADPVSCSIITKKRQK